MSKLSWSLNDEHFLQVHSSTGVQAFGVPSLRVNLSSHLWQFQDSDPCLPSPTKLLNIPLNISITSYPPLKWENHPRENKAQVMVLNSGIPTFTLFRLYNFLLSFQFSDTFMEMVFCILSSFYSCHQWKGCFDYTSLCLRELAMALYHPMTNRKPLTALSFEGYN